MTRARDARERIVTTAPAPDAGARREVDAHDSLIACWDLLLAANKGRYDMVGGMVVVVDRGWDNALCRARVWMSCTSDMMHDGLGNVGCACTPTPMALFNACAKETVTCTHYHIVSH